MGRVISQRRTREEWELLIAMHRGWYPMIDRQTFRRMGPAPRDRDADGPSARPAASRPRRRSTTWPRRYPLETRGMGRLVAPRCARRASTARGRSSGWEPGKGADLRSRGARAGRRRAPTSSPTEITYTYARTGEQVTRTGRVTVYTGFQWRGRSTVGGADDVGAARGDVRRARLARIEGRWFTGGYDEIGIDVQLDRVGKRDHGRRHRPRGAADRRGTGQTLKILRRQSAGVAAGRATSTSGAGVTRHGRHRRRRRDHRHGRRGRHAPRSGPRDARRRPARSSRRAVTVYDKVDHDPRDARRGTWRASAAWSSRSSSPHFDAWALHNGPDKKPDTDDDLKLDVGRRDLERRGIHGHVRRRRHQVRRRASTRDGPVHAERRRARTRSAAASATTSATSGWWPATPPAAARRRRCRARAHLLVTVPLYMQVRSHGDAMSTATCPSTLGVGEFHRSRPSGQRFVYLVPSAAVFAFDDCADGRGRRCCAGGPQTPGELLAALGVALRRRPKCADTLERAAPRPRHRRTGGRGRRRRRSSRSRRSRSRRWC